MYGVGAGSRTRVRKRSAQISTCVSGDLVFVARLALRPGILVLSLRSFAVAPAGACTTTSPLNGNFRGHGRLPGSWSRPLFRRRERTRCRSLFVFCPFLRGLGRLGTRPELCKPPSKPFRPRVISGSKHYSGSGAQRRMSRFSSRPQLPEAQLPEARRRACSTEPTENEDHRHSSSWGSWPAPSPSARTRSPATRPARPRPAPDAGSSRGPYANAQSGLGSTTVQGAIDEIGTTTRSAIAGGGIVTEDTGLHDLDDGAQASRRHRGPADVDRHGHGDLDRDRARPGQL